MLFNPDTKQMVEQEIESFLSRSVEHRDEIIKMLQDPLNMAPITANIQRRLVEIKDALFHAERDRLTQAYHQQQVRSDIDVLARFPILEREFINEADALRAEIQSLHQEIEVYNAQRIELHHHIDELQHVVKEETSHVHRHPSVPEATSHVHAMLDDRTQKLKVLSDLVAERKTRLGELERRLRAIDDERITWRREQIAAQTRKQLRRRFVGEHRDECLSDTTRAHRDNEIAIVQSTLDAKLAEYSSALDIRVSFEFIRACRQHFEAYDPHHRAEYMLLIDKSERYLCAYLQLQRQDLKISALKKNLQLAHDIMAEHQQQRELTMLAKAYLEKAKEFGVAGLIASGVGLLSCGAMGMLFPLLPPLVMGWPFVTIAAGLWLVAMYDGIQSCLKHKQATATEVDITRLVSQQDKTLPQDSPTLLQVLEEEEARRAEGACDVESKRLALREGILTPSLMFWLPHPSAPPLNDWPNQQATAWSPGR